MSIDPLQEPKPVQAARSIAAALSMIGVAIAAFFLSTYIAGATEWRIPVANLFMAILLCTAGLVLSAIVLRGRGSWREAASLILPAVVAGAAAFRFGFAGVVSVVVAASLVGWLLQWRRRSTLSSR
jgi:hypothetical protein